MPAPLAVSSNPIDLDCALGASGEKEYRRLTRVARMAHGRFHLFPVESNLPRDLRDALFDRLRSDLSASNLRLRVLTLTANCWNILTLLEQEGPVLPDEVVMLVGLEETPRIVMPPDAPPQRPDALALLNQARSLFRERIPAPLFVWCPGYAYTALMEHAPDFFDHYTSQFSFHNQIVELEAKLVARTEITGSLTVEQAPLSARTGAKALRAFYEQEVAVHPDPTPQRARALLGLVEALLDLPQRERYRSLVEAQSYAEEAIRLLARRRNRNDRREWARSQVLLGKILCFLPTGNRSKNLQQAIVCYEAALRVYTQQDLSWEGAATQNNLGNAYGDLPTGDRGANLQKAIACYEAALKVYTQQDFPQDWAMTLNNLGNTYDDLPTGDRGANLQHAIACYEAALKVRTEQDFPQDWAMTQSCLGIAYSYLPTGDRGANLQHAIACYEAALKVRTEQDFPQDWATTQNNLGIAYGYLHTGERGTNLQRAIACFEAALKVFTEQDFPQNWAITQNNLAIALENSARNAWMAAERGYRAVGMEEEASRMGRRASRLSAS